MQRNVHCQHFFECVGILAIDQPDLVQVTDGNGQVLSEDDDRRSQYWQFVRGPLPPLPAQSLESPWFLLTMQ